MICRDAQCNRTERMPVVAERRSGFQKFVYEYVCCFLIIQPFYYFFPFDMSEKKFAFTYQHFFGEIPLYFIITIACLSYYSFLMPGIIFIIHINTFLFIKNRGLHIPDFFYAE